MTSKIQIDDEMIRRFREAAGPYLGLPKPPCGALLSEEAIREWKKEVARGILEKTLAQAAPEEPEIPVSHGMMIAGLHAYNDLRDAGEGVRGALLAAAYVAMEKARRKERPIAYCYWDKNDRRQRGVVVFNDRRKGDRRGADRFIKQQAERA